MTPRTEAALALAEAYCAYRDTSSDVKGRHLNSAEAAYRAARSAPEESGIGALEREYLEASYAYDVVEGINQHMLAPGAPESVRERHGRALQALYAERTKFAPETPELGGLERAVMDRVYAVWDDPEWFKDTELERLVRALRAARGPAKADPLEEARSNIAELIQIIEAPDMRGARLYDARSNVRTALRKIEAALAQRREQS